MSSKLLFDNKIESF